MIIVACLQCSMINTGQSTEKQNKC